MTGLERKLYGEGRPWKRRRVGGGQHSRGKVWTLHGYCSFSIRVGHAESFPGGSDGKESVSNVGDLGLIPGIRRSPGGGHGNPLQYSCLENPHGQGVWQATVHGVAESDMTE